MCISVGEILHVHVKFIVYLVLGLNFDFSKWLLFEKYG